MTTIKIPFPDNEKVSQKRTGAVAADNKLINLSFYEFVFTEYSGKIFLNVSHFATDPDGTSLQVNRSEFLPEEERSPQLIKQRLIELMTSEEYRQAASASDPKLLYTKTFLEGWLTINRLTENLQSTFAPVDIQGTSPVDGQSAAVRDIFHHNTKYVKTDKPLALFEISKTALFALDKSQGSLQEQLREAALATGLFIKPEFKFPNSTNIRTVVNIFDDQSDAYFFTTSSDREVEVDGFGTETVEELSLTAVVPTSLLKQDPRAAEAEASMAAAEQQRLLEEGEGGPGLTDAQRKNSLPLNEQAILLYHLGELMGSNRKKRNAKEYDRFACVECESNDEIAMLPNILTTPQNLSPLFDRIRPVHLSAVIPRVRLFKQYHKNSTRMKGKKMNDPDEPRTLVEYEFEEHIDKNILNKTLSTNTGVGLESFSFDFNGTNEFESERMVSANLKIKAQSVDALETLRKSNTSKGSEYQYRFSDLFIPDIVQSDDSGNRRRKTDYITYEVKNFETRVCIEYTADRTSPVFNQPYQDGKLIADALDSMKLDINLVLTSHTIDLRDDGSLTVDINFVGRLDAMSGDPKTGNIMPYARLTDAQTQALLNERAAAQSELIDLEATRSELQRRAHELEENAPEDKDFQEITTSEIKAIATREAELRNKFGINDNTLEEEDRFISGIENDTLRRLKLYRSILGGLLKRDAVHVIKIDPSDIAKKYDRQNPDASLTGGCIVSAGQSTTPFAGEGKNTEKMTKKDDFDDEFKEMGDRLRSGIVPLYQDDEYLIRFFYFGDLMDVVLDNMYEGKYEGNDPDEEVEVDLRTILGPIEIKRNVFDDSEHEGSIKFTRLGKLIVADKYTSAYDVVATRNVKKAVQQVEKHIAEGDDPRIARDYGLKLQPVFASLADIPISVNLFLRWFAENISNKGVFGYSFKKFLVDATQSLIVASLQADSTRILLPKQKRRVKLLSWDSHSQTSKPDAFGFVQVPSKGLKITLTEEERGKNTAYSQISQITKKLTDRPKRKDPYMSDYAMVYAEAPRYNRKFDGNHEQYLRDVKDGIYHLGVGRDVGMVKDISLSATSIPGYEEMQIQSALKDQERPKKRVYEATVTMFGTTFFRPGQMVYIHAAAYGTLDNLKSFGLGGYYTVRTVSTNFSSGNFETTLVCDFNQGG